MRRSGRLAALRVVDCSPTQLAVPAKPAAPPAEKRRRRSSAAAPSPAEPAPPLPAGRAHEAAWWAKGFARVAGVDEAGRGPLAGPVVAAAVVCPPHIVIPGVDDSKKLKEAEREALYAVLTTHPAVEWAVCVVPHDQIDRVNILQATFRAMEGAVAGLPTAPNRVLIDGPHAPAGLAAIAETVVGGDGLSFAIGAASIIAKVTRDRLMVALDAKYPVYGFAKHSTSLIGPPFVGEKRSHALNLT